MMDEHLKYYKTTAGYQALHDWYEDLLNTIQVPCNSRYVGP